MNKIKDLLCSLGICDESSVTPFFPRVRDREDVKVFKCQKSGVIFLSRSDHMEQSHYEDFSDLSYWGSVDRKAGLATRSPDDTRRSNQFRKIISGKVWLDVGTGLGGVLDLLKTDALVTLAVEPQQATRKCLQDAGYIVYRDLEDVPQSDIDVVTLFHVMEHLIEPLKTLSQIKKVMKPGGKIIIEVPHANDALFSLYDSEAFKIFSLWSEHLILHTRKSLEIFLTKAGFYNITISGFQRYPLANHLYWLAKGKPGGHKIWEHFRDAKLEKAYDEILCQIDQTDTLIAIAQS